MLELRLGFLDVLSPLSVTTKVFCQLSRYKMYFCGYWS